MQKPHDEMNSEYVDTVKVSHFVSATDTRGGASDS